MKGFSMTALMILCTALVAVPGVAQEEPHSFAYQWSTGDTPWGVALDPSGNYVYVSLFWGHTIQKFDRAGDLITQIGHWGRNYEYELSSPRGVAVDSAGNIYVADFDNWRVQKFDSDGNFLLMFGWRVATGVNQFEICYEDCHLGGGPADKRCGEGAVVVPYGVAVDRDDNVWVTSLDCVQKFDSQGNYLDQFGAPGTGPGEYTSPFAVVFDSADNMYLSDDGRIQKFDSSGNFLYQLSMFVQAFPTVDSVNNVYVPSHTWVRKFDSEGNFLVQWGGSQTGGTGNGLFGRPQGLAVDSAGYLFAADAYNDLIQVFAPPILPLSCTGFQPPMASGPVTARGPRALPLKAQLFDAEGYEMTDLELTAPPVLQVIFTPAEGGGAIDVTDDALPVGFGTEGNQFEYNLADQVWQYNLKTKDYTAAGTYTITMVSGDDSEYLIDPTCEATFERQE